MYIANIYTQKNWNMHLFIYLCVFMCIYLVNWRAVAAPSLPSPPPIPPPPAIARGLPPRLLPPQSDPPPTWGVGLEVWRGWSDSLRSSFPAPRARFWCGAAGKVWISNPL